MDYNSFSIFILLYGSHFSTWGITFSKTGLYLKIFLGDSFTEYKTPSWFPYFVSALWKCYLIFCTALLLLRSMIPSLHRVYLFSLAALKFSSSLVFWSFITMCLGMSLFILFPDKNLYFLNIKVHVFFSCKNSLNSFNIPLNIKLPFSSYSFWKFR